MAPGFEMATRESVSRTGAKYACKPYMSSISRQASLEIALKTKSRCPPLPRKLSRSMDLKLSAFLTVVQSGHCRARNSRSVFMKKPLSHSIGRQSRRSDYTLPARIFLSAGVIYRVIPWPDEEFPAPDCNGRKHSGQQLPKPFCDIAHRCGVFANKN